VPKRIERLPEGKVLLLWGRHPGDATSTADVDHFLPLTLGARHPEVNWNGVWNLVLACWECNRAPAGKHARAPDFCFLEALEARNGFFIESHHPLRETLMNQ